MKNLIKLIGKAPSELSFQDLLIRIKEERQRVMANIISFREKGKQVKVRKKAKSKKGLSNKNLLDKNKKLIELLNLNNDVLS